MIACAAEVVTVTGPGVDRGAVRPTTPCTLAAGRCYAKDIEDLNMKFCSWTAHHGREQTSFQVEMPGLVSMCLNSGSFSLNTPGADLS
jgi:hypothetical protein